MVEKKYFLIVEGTFDRAPILFDEYPADEQIAQALVELNGESARIEERYVLKNAELTRTYGKLSE